jgi:mRNA interferase MazF
MLSTWPGGSASCCEVDVGEAAELLGQDVREMVEQTTAVDPQRLGDFAGRLDPDELMEINVALRAVLDLE